MMQFFGKIISKLLGQKILLSVPSEYKCQVCENTYPLNIDHFQKVNNFKHGYSTYCNACDKNSAKRKE